MRITPAAQRLIGLLVNVGAQKYASDNARSSTKKMSRLVLPGGRFLAVQHDVEVPRLYVLREHAKPFIDAGLPVEIYEASRTRNSNLDAVPGFKRAALAKVIANDVTATAEAARLLARS